MERIRLIKEALISENTEKTKGWMKMARRTETNNCMREKKVPIIWLNTNSCGGDTISLLNSTNSDYQEMITNLVNLAYNTPAISVEGCLANNNLDGFIDKPSSDYILVVEGSVPTRSNGKFAVVGRRNGEDWTALQAVQSLGAEAKYVIAAGTCASSGGISAASPNPSGSKPVQDVLNRKVINVPGCPINPDRFLGTLTHLIRFGEPELDQFNRPKMFFSDTQEENETREWLLYV